MTHFNIGSFSTGFSSSTSTNPFDTQVHDDFAAVFGGQQSTVDSTPAMGDILLPTVSSTGAPPAPVNNKISTGEQPGGLHASLERVAKSLGEQTRIQLSKINCVDTVTW